LQNAEIPAGTLNPVGFRLRGSTSWRAQKKSFKLDLNEYIKGQKLYGLEKLNVNGEHNDPAIPLTRLRSGIYFFAHGRWTERAGDQVDRAEIVRN